MSDTPDPSRAPSQHETPPAAKRPWLKWLGWLISAAVIIVVFAVLLPRIGDYGAAITAIGDMTLGRLAVLLGLTVVTLVPYWWGFQAAFPGLSFRRAAEVHVASTAVANTVPAGGAVALGVQVGMLASWRIGAEAIAAGLLVFGLWDTFLKLALPTVVAGISAISSDLDPIVQAVVLVAVVVMVGAAVVLWLVLRSEHAARSVGGWANRMTAKLPEKWSPVHQEWISVLVGFRRRTLEVLGSHGLQLTLTIAVAHVATFFLLLASLRFVGVPADEVNWTRILFAYSFIRLVTAIPVTPGGAGVAELGYAALLGIGASESTLDLIVAGVLVFRAATFLVPIPLGLLAWFTWRRGLATDGTATPPVDDAERPSEL